jgi:hypothetical protein
MPRFLQFRHWTTLSRASAVRNKQARQKNGELNRWDVVSRAN